MNPHQALVALNLVNGLGPVSIRRLAEALGSPEKAFDAPPERLREILGRWGTPEVVRAVGGLKDGQALQAELIRAQRLGVRVLTLLDSDYPEHLKTISDPPAVLYVKGTLVREDEAAVAIVGTRSATPYGLAAARRLGQELARAGVTVVSGLAEGIDRAGHEGALAGGGRTLAVVGHGLSHLYPAHHRGVAEKICASGCLISEFPMEVPPEKVNFPRRNRIIAGLSLGVVVVEAPEKSGALITAREALEQGREVFAVPGPAASRQSRGTHQLLRDGAKLTESARDILEELAPELGERLARWKGPSSSSRHCEEARSADETISKGEIAARPSGARNDGNLSTEESRVLEQVPVGAAVGLEELAQAASLEPARLLPALTALELKGLVIQLPARGYSRAS